MAPTEPDPVTELLPLTPAVFHILVSLTRQPRHGYGVIVDVRERTGGALRLGTGTLYTALKRLLDQGLVEELAQDDADSRRQTIYGTTPRGREVLRAETERLRGMVALAGTALPLTGADETR